MTFDTNTILIVVAILAALVILWLLLRGRRPAERVEKRHTGYVASSERPYMKAREDGAQGNSVADEVATATSDVAGQVIGLDVRAELPGATANPDNLELLKGVGPKFAARLRELGIARFDQLAALSENEVEILDGKLGPFKGRLARDRVVDQAVYLARGDVDGFEEKFGKLGG